MIASYRTVFFNFVFISHFTDTLTCKTTMRKQVENIVSFLNNFTFFCSQAKDIAQNKRQSHFTKIPCNLF